MVPTGSYFRGTASEIIFEQRKQLFLSKSTPNTKAPCLKSRSSNIYDQRKLLKSQVKY